MVLQSLKTPVGHSQVQLSYGVGSKHSPKSSQQHSCPRGGLGRGAPPPHQDTQTRPGGGRLLMVSDDLPTSRLDWQLSIE